MEDFFKWLFIEREYGEGYFGGAVGFIRMVVVSAIIAFLLVLVTV